MDQSRLCECGAVITRKPGPGRWPKRCADCQVPGNSTPAVCQQCGDSFVGRKGRKYCGDACRSAKAYSVAVDTGKAAARYQAARADGRYDEWLAMQRAKSGQDRPGCPHCGVPMPPRHRTSCGAVDCKLAATAQRMREYQRRRVAECRAKGESYYAKWRTPEHVKVLAALPKDPVKIRARKQEGWQRRRAQKRSVPFESFRHADVYRRDSWVCQLCRRPVDSGLAYPDPMSASLDHVVPLSRGGHHVWGNVQLAHLACNNTKQSQLDWTPEVARGCSEGPGQLGEAGQGAVDVDRVQVRAAAR